MLVRERKREVVCVCVRERGGGGGKHACVVDQDLHGGKFSFNA